MRRTQMIKRHATAFGQYVTASALQNAVFFSVDFEKFQFPLVLKVTVSFIRIRRNQITRSGKHDRLNGQRLQCVYAGY